MDQQCAFIRLLSQHQAVHRGHQICTGRDLSLSDCLQHAQLTNNLPAYTVGSLRASVQVECLVDVIDALVSADDPQEKLKGFTQALHEVFALGRSKKHMIQRQLGRLEPTPSLQFNLANYSSRAVIFIYISYSHIPVGQGIGSP